MGGSTGKRPQPTTTLANVLDQQRSLRTPEMEVAWQDFLEMSDLEQREVLFFGVLFTSRQAMQVADAMRGKK